MRQPRAAAHVEGSGMPQTITKGYKALLAEAEAAITTLTADEVRFLLPLDAQTFWHLD